MTTDVKCPDLRGTTITVGALSELDARPLTTQTSQCVIPSGANDDSRWEAQRAHRTWASVLGVSP